MQAYCEISGGTGVKIGKEEGEEIVPSLSFSCCGFHMDDWVWTKGLGGGVNSVVFEDVHLVTCSFAYQESTDAPHPGL